MVKETNFIVGNSTECFMHVIARMDDHITHTNYILQPALTGCNEFPETRCDSIIKHDIYI